MATEPFDEAVRRRASIHLQGAWSAFYEDPALNWRERTGDLPKARVRAWIDALKREIEHRERLERGLG